MPEPRGTASLSELDRDQAATFATLYAERPPAPVAVVIAAYNEEASVGTVVAAVPSKLCGLADRGHRGGGRVVRQDGADGVRGRGPGLRRPRQPGPGGRFAPRVPSGPRTRGRVHPHLGRRRPVRRAKTWSGCCRRWSTTRPTSSPARGGSAPPPATMPYATSVLLLFAALITALVRHKVTDPSCGIRAMKAEVTAEVVLDQPQYQASELLIGTILAGYRYKEVPIAMKARRSGQTKKGGNLLYGARFCSVVIGTWWRERSRSTKTKRS